MIESLFIGGGAGLALAAAGLNYAAVHPGCQWFGPVVCRGSADGPPRLALTFDDGPSPGHTERILGLLDRYKLPACFFCIGRNADAAPALLRAIDSAGHLLANHSYDHPTWGAFRGHRYWLDQVQRTNDTIHRVVGRTPRLFRPPMGIKTPRILCVPRRLGMVTVNWSHRGFDTRNRPIEQIVKRITRRLLPGAVLLMHDGLDPARPRRMPLAAQALPRIIEYALDAGFAFDRLDRLLGIPGYIDSGCTTGSSKAASSAVSA